MERPVQVPMADGSAVGTLYTQGAQHGWTSTDSQVHNPAQAERAFTKLLELLAT
jgi:hypothetical protein